MKNLLIFGTSDFSEVLAETISQDSPEINLQGFILNDEYYTCEFFSGRKVYKYSELENHFSPDETEILISIGYTKMNVNCEKIFKLLQSSTGRGGGGMENRLLHQSEGNCSCSKNRYRKYFFGWRKYRR